MSQRRRKGHRTGGGRPGEGATPFRPGPSTDNRPSTTVQSAAPPDLKPGATDTDYARLVESFSALEFDPKRPLRPGYGTAGRSITLKTNFFGGWSPPGTIFDYTVEIQPKANVNRLKTRIFELLEQSDACTPFSGHIAHDGKQRLVSAQELPQPLDIVVPFYEDGETGPRPGAPVYTVSIILIGQLNGETLTKYLDGDIGSRDYNTAPHLSALTLVLQQHAAKTGVRVGKNRYFFPSSQSQTHRLSMGIIALTGFSLSVRPTLKRLMVNVNTCMSVFIEPGNLAEALVAFNYMSMGAMLTLPKAFAKSLKVTTYYLGYKKSKPILSIASTSARGTRFQCEEFGGRISVEDYFFKKYNIKLKHPANLPVVDIGSARRAVYVPAELCWIEPGQPYRGKLTDVETAQMIRVAAKPPRVNAEAITGMGLPLLGLNPMRSPADGFGIAIDPQMPNIPARELDPASVMYARSTALVANGSWNIRNAQFQRGAVVTSWWVLVVRDGQYMRKETAATDPVLKGLATKFGAKLQRCGLQIPSSPAKTLVTPSLQGMQDASRAAALTEIRKLVADALKGNEKPSFILVLLSARDNFIYPGIKRMGDVDLGVHTIHMQLNKALSEKGQDQYLSNICLKVNSKLGGINHLLEPSAMKWLTKQKTMMVGVDVTHPSPGSRVGAPSIAAVVASLDDNFVQFPASLRIQKPDGNRESKEMVTELRDMLVERLLLYEKKNKTLPQRLIVFRDGVSEGQFDIVVREELAQILEAFKKLNRSPQPYRPLVAIVICGKRHNARLFDPSFDRNTKPGTVVDKGVTAVFDFDFYLQAHAGIQGTVKATHYTVVYDEFKLTADELQQGSNSFSHLYARATRAVSLVPAAYYADLACERGRYYLNDFMADDRTTNSGRGNIDREEENTRAFQAAKAAWGQGLHPDIRDSMFYI
ncbi:argonaute-like protein [Mycena polygramma]|nr:argonaute-like protein [Mycena polygramma]